MAKSTTKLKASVFDYDFHASQKEVGRLFIWIGYNTQKAPYSFIQFSRHNMNFSNVHTLQGWAQSSSLSEHPEIHRRRLSSLTLAWGKFLVEDLAQMRGLVSCQYPLRRPTGRRHPKFFSVHFVPRPVNEETIGFPTVFHRWLVHCKLSWSWSHQRED